MAVFSDCPFCTLNSERIVSDLDLVVIIRDGYPVSPGHTLIIPKRHVKSIFEATFAEREALLRGLEEAKGVLDKELSPAAYNIGIK